ncbi:O-antigen ligase [Aquabacterium sp. J223]|uniref:O-antigen ligase family protein n=1 Tax=Aquabacterium sp. J223 TaxID=2898431 RepID=UPI0021AD8F2F|nr:O-antigen ligase family protein [Aquabacterium sp. J223]UUX94807.1 hypothetical protein LRS07_16195 [Aquabacterium sp. J223]
MIRATAFHPTAQNLSHYLLIATSLLMLGPFSNRLRIVGGTLMGAGMFFTFTGNGLVVMSVLLLVTPIMLRPRLTIHYVAFLLLVGLIAYQTGVAEWVYEKYLLPISGKSAEDRIGLLQVGLEVMERHPFIGIGLNNFGRLSPQPVHNAYLQLATEIGLLPAALLCLILLGIFVRLVIGLRQTPPSDATKAGKGILLGLMGLALHFMFEPFINSLVSWSIIGLAEAAALLLYHSDERRADRRGTAHPALSTPP